MKVLIAGGGIGGLATAISLRRQGVDLVVLEQARELREVGAGITLWINAMRALRKLGLAEAVADAGVPASDGVVRTWRGRALTRSIGGELSARYGEVVVAMHRADLQRVLLGAVGPGVIKLGHRATGFEQHADSVTVRLADGGREHGDVLVGADGIWSRVRAQLHGDERPRYAGYTVWRGVIPFAHDGKMLESWGRGTRFGVVPIGSGRVYWFATANAPEGSHAEGGHKQELLRRFKEWHDPIPEVLERTPESAILRDDLYERKPLKRWGQGRVTLLGDAAHPMTPNLGQGACQAIEDAVVLARYLAQEPDVVAALRGYEARRIKRTRAIVAESRRFGRIAQLENPLAVRMRDALISRVPDRVQLKHLERVVGYEV